MHEPSIASVRHWIRKFDLMTLRLFASVNEERNIGRAAQRESIAPSAVTKRIHDLEEALGFRLLFRDTKRTLPTPAGEIVDRRFHQILDLLQDLHRELSDLTEGVSGRIRIWCTQSALVEYLAEDLSIFSRQYPGVALDLQEADSSAVVQAVLVGNADLGICAQSGEPGTRLHTRPYRSDRLVAVATCEHPIARRAHISFKELLETDLVSWSTQSAVIVQLQQAAQALGREFRPKYRVTSTESARSLARAGLAVAILPEGLIWPFEDAERICSVHISEEWARRQLWLHTYEGEHPVLAVRALSDFLTSQQA